MNPSILIRQTAFWGLDFLMGSPIRKHIRDMEKLFSEPPSIAWLWKLNANSKAKILGTGNLFITDLAFSPDSIFLVTTSFRVVDKTRVWKISDYK